MDVERFSPIGAFAIDRVQKRQQAMCVNAHGQWTACSRQEQSKQWISGFLTLGLVELMSTLIFGMIISSFFGWNIFNFNKPTNRYIWGGLVLFLIVTIGYYIYERGFTGLGAKHVQTTVNNLNRVNAQLRGSAFDPLYASKMETPELFPNTPAEQSGPDPNSVPAPPVDSGVDSTPLGIDDMPPGGTMA